MKTPNVGNYWRMGITKHEGKVDGSLDNAKEVMTRAKIDGINKQQKEIADKYIQQDNSPKDMDPRKGHVAVVNDVKIRSSKGLGFTSNGNEAVKVEYDTATGSPVEMSRKIDLKDYYAMDNQAHHSTGESTVKWDKDGSISYMKEKRNCKLLDRPNVRRGESIEIIKNDDGTLHYREQ